MTFLWHSSEAGRCQGLQEMFPDETADETRSFGRVEQDGKRVEPGRKPWLRQSEGELMGCDTLLTQFGTETDQNETIRKVI